MNNNVIKLVEVIKESLLEGNQDKIDKILSQVSVGILKDALKVAFKEESSDEASALLCHKLFVRGVSLEEIHGCFSERFQRNFIEKMIMTGFPDVAIFFIKNGYDITEKYVMNFTLLHIALQRARTKQYELVKAILKRNIIDVNCVTDRNNGPRDGFHNFSTPLYMAVHVPVISGQLKIAKLLVEAGADINAVEGNFNFTPFKLALYCGKLEFAMYMIEVDLERGNLPLANINLFMNKVNNSNLIPFNLALNGGNLEFAMYMIKVDLESGNLPLDNINLFMNKVYENISLNHSCEKDGQAALLKNLITINKFCKLLRASRFGSHYENDLITFYKRGLFKGLQMNDDGSTSLEKFKFQIIEEICKFVDKCDYFTGRHKIVLSFKDTVDQEKLWTDIFQRFFDLEIDEAKKLTRDFLDSDFCKTQKAIYQSLSGFNIPEDVIRFHIAMK